jgi:hypothetical protein
LIDHNVDRHDIHDALHESKVAFTRDEVNQHETAKPSLHRLRRSIASLDAGAEDPGARSPGRRQFLIEDRAR